jgi:hypothetical protein
VVMRREEPRERGFLGFVPMRSGCLVDGVPGHHPGQWSLIRPGLDHGVGTLLAILCYFPLIVR